MSLFTTPTKELIQSIQWFNSLNDEQRVLLLQAQFSTINFTDSKFSSYLILLKEIQTVLITKQREEVVSKLKELGIDQTSSSVLVNKILEEIPPYQLDAKLMNSATDDIFEKVTDAVLLHVYINNSTKEKIDQILGSDIELLKTINRLFRDVVLWKYLRGEISLETITEVLKNSYELSDKKTKMITDLLLKYEDKIYKKYLFRNAQDNALNLGNLIRNQEQLVFEVRELTAFLKQTYRNFGVSPQQPSAFQ